MGKLTVHRIYKFDFLLDPRISFKAKGILWFLMNPPEEWDNTIAGITKFSADGLGAVTSGVNELKKAGYLEVSRKRTASGLLGESEYIVHDTPINN